MKTISISILNIVLEKPHDENRYVELLVNASKNKQPLKLRADIGGFIGSAHIHKDNDGNVDYVWGELFKFVDLDLEGKWLDLTTGEAAEDDVIEEQVRVPKHLRPNLRILPYVFYPDVHRMAFISHLDEKNNISTTLAQNLVERVLRRYQDDKEQWVTVHVEPNQEALEAIFNVPRIKMLRLEISTPNSLDDIEEQVIEELEAINAKKTIQIYEENDATGLQPNEELIQLAHVAQSNGVVSAKVVNADDRVEDVSTNDHPFIKKIKFDNKVTVAKEAMIASSKEIIQSLLRKGVRNGRGR